MNKIKISLAGNPNVGKTSLFNAMTSSAERVGNWHGVTVVQKQKIVDFEGVQTTVVDLPGFYSMSAYSYEEEISRNEILFGKNDVIICVCEARNLARNLYLTLQLMEAGARVVVAINMIDELQKKGYGFDVKRLSKVLGVPVIAVSSKNPEDVKKLLALAIKSAGEKQKSLDYFCDLPINEILTLISPYISNVKVDARFLAVKLLEDDEYVRGIVDLPQNVMDRLSKYGDFSCKIATARYDFINMAIDGVILKNRLNCSKLAKNIVKLTNYDTHSLIEADDYYQESAWQKSIDKIVLNKYLALPIFLLITASIFFIVFGSLGNFISRLIDKHITNALFVYLLSAMQSLNLPEYLVSLVCNGVVLGVGGVLEFLPQVALLFIFLTLLEESGYISRLAFVTDGFFNKIGLSGRAVFTMIMGLGCSATAVLTARGLNDAKMRKKTALITPFVSCTARFPIYATIFSAFFAKNRPFLILFLYLLGCAVALFWAIVLGSTKTLKSTDSAFIMEMPPYRIPRLNSVVVALIQNLKSFFTKIATVVFAMNIIVWILANFSLESGYILSNDTEKSILNVLASIISPVFVPLGFGDWKCIAALLSGLIAKESVVSVIESFGGVTNVFLGTNADITTLCFAVFSLLYVPCVATMSVINKELGAKWMFLSIFMHICSAYSVALFVRVCCLLLRYYTVLTISIITIAIIMALVVKSIISMMKRRRVNCCSCKNCNGACG